MKRRTVSWRRATPGLAMLATLIAALAWASRPAFAAPSIVTDQGPLKGVVVSNVNEYLGIPYAAPPVRKRRWQPPQAPARFDGLFEATQFGSECMLPAGPGQTSGSENCLFLNVYTPTVSHSLPVMVFIHGAGTGSSLFDPTPLVEKGGVIVVTINYRIGVLGFFAHPALDGEGHLNANYGLMDQQFALKWVRRNIPAFGGNRNRITIFGASQGGLSVYSQLASPTAAGLFQGAIAQSGSYASFADYLESIVPLAAAEPAGTAFAATVGCSSQTADCLRNLSASTLVEAQGDTNFFVDGTVLTQPPGAALASGAFNRVPVISGTTHDEWRLFVAQQYDFEGNPLTAAGYLAAMESLWTPGFGDFLAATFYALGSYPSASIALGTSGTDGIFSCPARHAVQSLSQYVSTYAYEFSDENAPVFAVFPAASFPLGAFHGADSLYLFNIPMTAAFSPEQQQLSDTMVGYWTQFAKTGDPNFAGAPAWSAYDAITDQFQSLVAPLPGPDSNFSTDHFCSSLWDFI